MVTDRDPGGLDTAARDWYPERKENGRAHSSQGIILRAPGYGELPRVDDRLLLS